MNDPACFTLFELQAGMASKGKMMKPGRQVSRLGVLVILLFSVPCAQVVGQQRWLPEAGYGLMFHYQAFKNHSPESYNRAIDSFDVGRFA
ncbi:MAG: hypothetical protein QGH11_12405, partial [Pirellulaceae bacterium]|nr:hypothetical protein [Pirellulaceae bacterium]